MEDLLYEVESVRRFAGLRLSGALPDETTILKFRHLLERHGLGEALFEEINAQLAARGHRLKRGTIVDASLIDAPCSTKNQSGERRLLDKDGPEEAIEKGKASVRAKVEHPFLHVKRHFGYRKARYRGLAKNTQRIALLLGFANLLIAGRYASA